ncbi:MAG: hypothetical protein PVJ05_07220 [Candidatus Thorarchaeota archaeon]|jgi:hypothetical protein
MIPLNNIPARVTVGTSSSRFYSSILEQEVINVIVTERITSFGKTIIEIVTPARIKKRKLEEYKDDSIELRRYLAAEIAHREFEQHKERALTENHRAGFLR